MNSSFFGVTIMWKTLCVLLVVASVAVADVGEASIDLRVTSPHVAQVWIEASVPGDQPEDPVGIQIAIAWDPPTAVLTLESLLPTGIESLWLTPEDGDAMAAWIVDTWADPPEPLPQIPFGLFEFSFDVPGVTVETLVQMPPHDGGFPTRIVLPGGIEIWDGQTMAITLPEPTSLVLLAIGGLAMRRWYRTPGG